MVYPANAFDSRLRGDSGHLSRNILSMHNPAVARTTLLILFISLHQQSGQVPPGPGLQWRMQTSGWDYLNFQNLAELVKRSGSDHLVKSVPYGSSPHCSRDFSRHCAFRNKGQAFLGVGGGGGTVSMHKY